MNVRVVSAALALLVAAGAGLAAQQGSPPPATAAVPVTYKRLPADQFAVLEIGNRPIVTFRAEFLTRSPAERADAAQRRFATLSAEGVAAPVSQRSVLDLIVITVAGRDMFTVTPADADELAGETQVHVALAASRQLEQALRETVELRQPARLARAGSIALGFTVILLAVIWILRRVYHALGMRMQQVAERQFERARLTEHVAVDTGRLVYWLQRGLRGVAAALAMAAVYIWITSVFVLFPYTRPWGEALGGFLARTAERIATSILDAIPGLFYIAIIVVLTRFAIRVMEATLDGVAAGRLQLPGIHAETAVPTKRLLAGVLWLFAIIVSYPYMPGANTEAFKGVSVFVGLVLTLGSSGLVNHVMSGFLLTFTRAIRVGDYVKAGDTEGTVTMLGLLSTKVRTIKGEEVVLPNAVAIGGTIVNYSRYASAGELLLHTSITIGYDTPWRQVDALLRAAAERTDGLSTHRAPFVLQRALSDFYVEYQINAVLEQPERRGVVLSELHAHIQDAFNEAQVQIMSPHYEADPEAPKLALAGPAVAVASR